MKLYGQPKPYLEEGNNIVFSENWNVAEVSGKYFSLGPVQRIKFDRHFTLDTDATKDYDLDEDAGVVPDKSNTLYEIHVSFKGEIMVYPRYPLDTYFLKLEESGFRPDYTDSRDKFLGYWNQSDSPYEEPKVVWYSVDDMNPAQFRLYNDSITPERLVIRFVINRCKLETELDTKPDKYRYIFHYDDFRW